MNRTLAFLLALALSLAPLHAQDINNPQTNASALTTGTVAAARGGAGTINGALAGNGSGVVSQAATTQLSDVTAATTWTPTDQSGAALTFSTVTGNFSKGNKTCVGSFRLTYPVTADGTLAKVSLPCTVAANNAHALGVCWTTATLASGNELLVLLGNSSAATAAFVNAGGSGSSPANSNLATFIVSCNFSFITT